MKRITLTFFILLILFTSVNAQQIDRLEIVRAQSFDGLIWDQFDNYNHNIAFITDTNDLPLNSSSTDNNTNTTIDTIADILTIRFVDATPNTRQNINTAAVTNYNAFLIWGNNGAALDPTTSPVTVNLSSELTSSITTNVSYTAMQRTWKIIQVSEDTPTVNIKIPQESIPNNATIGSYYMLISDSDQFDSTVDHRILTLDAYGNLETTYNFDGTAYITFGFSPQITEERSIYFKGSDSYIDMRNTLDLNPAGFTISAWIKHESTTYTGDVSILSKRDVAFTQGYDFTLTDANKVQINWKNNSHQSLTSYTSIPDNEWHHIAVTYDGSKVAIYIDGVLDNSATKSAPIATNASFLIAAAGKITPIQHFKGHIDEVRIWNTFLTEDQLRFIMNQEIADNSGYVIGKTLPVSITKNDIHTIPWSDLAAYYPMSHFTFKNTIDASGNGNNGQLKHLLTVDKETAPLPYTSAQNGDWSNHLSWSNGNVQYAPGSTSIVNPNKTIDWNIVRTSHNLTMTNLSLPTIKNHNRTLLGLFVDANQLLVAGETATNTGNGLTISHYLGLTGSIDLEGESQLIQTLGSDLKVIGNGRIERDQQGTADTFTYNYWSSPVTKENSTAHSFKISDVMKDGTTASNPTAINFSSSGYNGADTHPIKIADYWIWKYTNLASNSYSAWQHIRRTGTILPGEGFTMKGPGTGSITAPQNYVFSGKPNNGNINLTLAANNDYLVGNPYPSAIDAVQFIKDNGPELNPDGSFNPNSSPLISGTLYFWNHWGGGSHVLQNYQGGYASYNLSGAIAAAYKGSNYSGLNIEGSPTKKPGRSISVGQGFFIVGQNSGTIKFNNGQRIFKKEGNSSVFMRSATTTASPNNADAEGEDTRLKFRIGFNSVNTIRRQLLLTIDENATPGVDWAYDGILYENQIDDMFWLINDDAYIIQASNEADVSTTYPLGIKTQTDGINSIMIDALENVPDTIHVYLHDIALDLYHDLRTGNYDVFLNAGDYRNRFEITFSNTQDGLGIDDKLTRHIDVLYSNAIDKVVIVNPNQIEVKAMTLFNMLGQSVYTTDDISPNTYSEYKIKNLSAGTYIIKLQTAMGFAVTKKILVD